MRRRHPRPGRSSRRRGRQKGGAGEPVDHALGRSRGGFGTKIHLVACAKGVPLAAVVTAGQRHESTQFEAVMEAVRIPSAAGGRPRCRPMAVAGDRGYSYGRIRFLLASRGIRAVIPQRSDQVGGRGRPPSFDPKEYRRRNAVERCVGWLKEWRGVATRHEKLAETFLAVVHLAMCRRYLRLLDS